MNKEDKAKIVAWTYAISDFQRRVNKLKRKMARLNSKRLDLLGDDVTNIDISNVDLETWEGEIEVERNAD